MWIDLISRDETLRETLLTHCAIAEDYWTCKAAYQPGERQHLMSFQGLVIFDLRTATEEDRRHFLAEAPRHAGLTYLVVNEESAAHSFLDTLPPEARIDVLAEDTPLEVLRQRLNYARDTRAVDESRKASRAGAAREALRFTRFQALIDQAPFILITLDPSGRVTHSNALARVFFGKGLDTIRGTDLLEFAHPDDRQPLFDATTAALNTGHSFRREVRFRHLDSSWRWMCAAGGPAFDAQNNKIGVSVALTDTTEERAANEALREREHTMRTLADFLPMKVWRGDARMRPDYFNKAWMTYTGLSLQSPDIDEWLLMLHPHDRKRAKRLAAKALATATPVVMEVRFKEARSERYRWQRLEVVPIKDEKGEVRRWFGAAIDIDDTRRETNTIAGLYRELLAINKSKDALLMALPSELRAPLAELLKWRVFFASEDLSQDDRAALDAVFRNAEALLRHVENLLDLSQMVTGRMKIEVAPTDLKRLTETVARAFDDAFHKAGITFERHLDSELGLAVVDAHRVGQVIWNLLNNALKFTPEGGRVWLSLDREQDTARLAVGDTGKGIAPEFLDKIFTRFVQEENYATRQQGGLGLGLAITKHIVDLHGGCITATSPGRNKGALFEIRLPLRHQTH